MRASPPLVLALCLFSSILCGIADYVTGPDIVFTSVYMLPVIAAAWWLGRTQAVAISLASAAIYLTADILARRTYLAASGRLWNTGVQLAVLLCVTGLVAALKQLLEDSRDARKRLHALSGRLLEVQETERRRIARELHDEVGQVLTAVKISLDDLQRHEGNAALVPRIQRSAATVDLAIQQVRNLSLDLRPSVLDDLGLASTLRWYLDRQAQQGGIEGHLSTGPLRERFPPEVEIACFRVVQECITNVLRHARARQVWVELHEKRLRLELLVRDDGAGFDLAAARRRATAGTAIGLSSMEERVSLAGGELAITTEEGGGTEVQAWFPLDAQP